MLQLSSFLLWSKSLPVQWYGGCDETPRSEIYFRSNKGLQSLLQVLIKPEEAMAVGIMMMTAPLLRPTCRVQYLTSE
jgi:hypothetical protein